MAVTYRAGSVQNTDDLDNDESVTATVPSGMASGDVWVVLIQFDLDYYKTGDILVPSGWNAISDAFTTASQWPWARGFWKAATGSDSNQEFTIDPDGGGVYRVRVCSFALTGANTSDPIDVVGAAVQSTDAPDVTVAADGSIAVIWCVWSDSEAGDAPSGTELDHADGFASSCVAYEAVDAGGYSPGSFDNPLSESASQTIIFQPAGGASRTALVTRSKPLGIEHGMNFGVQR